MAYRQCPRRLWLEVHRPDLREDSASSQARFDAGHEVGEIARRIYDPQGKGALLDLDVLGVDGAIKQTKALLPTRVPIFEAGFVARRVRAFADVLLPVRRKGRTAWRMVEVKSSTSVKDYHRDDVATQALLATESGVDLAEVAVAHIDSRWTYRGRGDYSGLLVEADLSNEALDRGKEVRRWIKEAHAIVDQPKEPDVRTGRHCSTPYECGFHGYCSAREPPATVPAACLPRVQTAALRAFLDSGPAIEMADVPDGLLNERQRRVKDVTLSGKPYFDKAGARRALAGDGRPAYFLDFETVMFAVPRWAGKRPYQQIPFQFSLHRLSMSGALEHTSHLDLSGEDPSRGFAEALVAACGKRGPIYVYNVGFERARIMELAQRYPALSGSLTALVTRLRDLLPVVMDHYYHPAQEGSWSIKALLPTIAADLHYEGLDGVQDGGMAMAAYQEAIDSRCPFERRESLKAQLLRYCERDTLALVSVWTFLRS
ncbi:DUF2779 domain-containing protein [Arenimonas caeni]|uniref:DUF2779 domain-containing protein n=2 Tax=Arenimonas caeni TaxID=2058085 RepID=A0A2P6M5N3_9GAMM|nr:DUF2779 domain-containing protein [Arenimonas caeni]